MFLKNILQIEESKSEKNQNTTSNVIFDELAFCNINTSWVIDILQILKIFDKIRTEIWHNEYIKEYKRLISKIISNHKFWEMYLDIKTKKDWLYFHNIKDILDDLIYQKIINQKEYIFIFWALLDEANVDWLFDEVEFLQSDANNKSLKWLQTWYYCTDLVKQNKYSKIFTDNIKWLPEISEDIYMITMHIDAIPRNAESEKFDIKIFGKFIYESCKYFESSHKIKPKYIYAVTHLKLLLHRYWFDIYDLDDDLSIHTSCYKSIINNKKSKKPRDFTKKQREEYKKNHNYNIRKMQNKFTHKDIKLGIMDYDKFIAKIQQML